MFKFNMYLCTILYKFVNKRNHILVIMKQSIFIRRKTVWLLITLFSVIANVNVCAQELDFSKLDEAQPQETLLQVEKYKEALGTTWQNISSVKNGVYWNVPYSNQEFSLTFYTRRYAS